MSRNHTLLFTTLSLLLVDLACTDERAPRSFVQPNALKKADLQGSWYYLTTVLDAPPSSTQAFIGLSSDLMKIKFDIQEGVLYARRAFEQIIGSEDNKAKEDKGYLGQPLAAWKVSSHFDIIREYNSTTGEETNKIIESTERPWSEREFIRVDWSRNLINNYTGLFFDPTMVESVSYWESDPDKPEAIHMERAEANDAEFGKGEANYLDVTNKLVLSAEDQTYCYSDGTCFQVPACYFYYSISDCASSVVKVRHAFSKISAKHDYEPRKWDGKQMELFGLWDVGLNRLSYNRQYGITNSGISRHAARFNLWKKSYNADGSKIPYAERELRTIPYYADTSGPSFPEDIFVEGQKVIDQWNEAVAVAVKAVTGTMPTQRIFIWCHNPVKLAADDKGPPDPIECKEGLKPDLDAKGNTKRDALGNPILWARTGDPRRSRMFWVNQYQAGGPLGYGPPMFDPETGETLSGQAYIYGANLDTYATRGRDLVLLITGRLDPEQYIQGANVKEWVTKMREGISQTSGTFSGDDVQRLTKAMDFTWAEGFGSETKVDTSSVDAYKRTFRTRQDSLFKSGVFGRGQTGVADERRRRLYNSPIEAMMITPDMLASVTGNGLATKWSALTEAEKTRVSPLRASQLDRLVEERKKRLMALGVDFADFADEMVAQRAVKLAQQAGGTSKLDPEKLWADIRKDIFSGLSLHEMGHNVGLRHNFRASYDSLNYHARYWQLRTQGAQSTRRYAGINSTTGQPLGVPYRGTDCTAGRLRPRYADCPGGALSVEEVTGGIGEYQYSSVMDYGAEFNSDLMGLGKYDKAAMKFAYAGDGYVEVFTRARTTDDTSLARLTSLQYFSGAYGYPSPINLFSRGLQGIAYQTYPSIFTNGAADIEAREDVPYADVELYQPNIPLLVDKKTKANRATLKPMVPYFFCGDEFVGNLTCMRYDAGADAYEQAADTISRYENYYLLNNFKRDRYLFHLSSSYGSNIVTRYLEPLRSQMTWYTLFRAIFTGSYDPTATDGGALFDNEAGWGNFTVAVTQGFDMLGRIIAQPEAGQYELYTADRSYEGPYDVYRQVSDDTTPDPTGTAVTVALGDGKYFRSTWDFDNCGYYWATECESRIGYLYDKIFALQVLAGSDANFTGRDTATDLRFYSIGYILPFRNQLLEKMGALLAGDYQSLAPSIANDGRTIERRSWTLNDAGGTRQRLLDPATGFTLQLYAAIYGLSGFPTTFDETFLDSTRIFVVGNGEAPVPDSALLAAPGVAGAQATFNPTELVSNVTPGTKSWFLWTDSATGKTYAARAFRRTSHDGANGSYRIDSGARMLELLRTLQGEVTTACAASGNPTVCRIKTRALQSYRENVDLMRTLHHWLGYTIQ